MTTPTTTAPASVTLRLQAVLLAAADELTPDLLQPEPGGPARTSWTRNSSWPTTSASTR